MNPTKNRDEFRFSGRASSSCSTCDTYRVVKRRVVRTKLHFYVFISVKRHYPNMENVLDSSLRK